MSQYWLMHVFDNLSFGDLHSCYKVSKLWREVATSPALSLYACAHPISTYDLSNLSHTCLTRLSHLSFAGGFSEIDFSTVGKVAAIPDRICPLLLLAFPFLTNLRSLDLSGTRVTEQITKALLDPSTLPSLHTLNLQNCKFLKDFRPIQTLAQERNNIKIVLGDNKFQSRWYKSPTPTHITFCNTTPAPVYPCWLDFSGKLVFDSKIMSGDYCTQNSYDSHPWVILTESGETIMRLVATKHPQVISIGDFYPISLVPIPQKLVTVAKEKEVSIMMYNKSGCFLNLSSLDFTGNEEHFEQIPPDGRKTIKTYETVPWMIWDEDGALEHVTIVGTKVPVTHMVVKVLGSALTCTRYGHHFSANQ